MNLSLFYHGFVGSVGGGLLPVPVVSLVPLDEGSAWLGPLPTNGRMVVASRRCCKRVRYTCLSYFCET